MIAESKLEFVGVLVSSFEFVPLKRLNKKAIEIADSHGGNKATSRSGTGSTLKRLAEHVILYEEEESTSVMVDGKMRSGAPVIEYW